MNRKKKINETLKRKAKKMNQKRNPKKKAPYVSKADREKIENASEQLEALEKLDSDLVS
jgi:ribosomal protein L14E/L6E/L27E